MRENELSYQIRGAIFTVHTTLGPGLLESVYENALLIELEERGLAVRSQVAGPFVYKAYNCEVGFRMDLLVEDQIILEIKSVELLNPVHFKQLLTYLRLSKRKLGFLINFNVQTLVDRESLIRIINSK